MLYFRKYLFLAFLLSQFSLHLYATQEDVNCNGALGKKQGQPVFISELRKLKLSALNSADRASRLLIEKTFEQKLDEAATALKISKKEVSKLIEDNSDITMTVADIKKVEVPVKREKDFVYKTIEESFKKSYPEQYNEIKNLALAYFKEITGEKTSLYPELVFDPGKKMAPTLYLFFENNEDAEVSRLHLKAAFLMEALQEEFAEQEGVTLNPIHFDFRKNVFPIRLALFAEDKTLTKAAFLLEVELKLSTPESAGLINPLFYYLAETIDPKLEFIQFLENELGESLKSGDRGGTNLVHLLTNYVNTDVSVYSRDSTNTIPILEYIYSKHPELFSMKNGAKRIPMNEPEIRPEVLEWMIGKGFDLNDQDYEGKTLLMHVAKIGFVEKIELLVKAGADKKLKDRDGKTALDYAIDSGDPYILELLEK